MCVRPQRTRRTVPDMEPPPAVRRPGEVAWWDPEPCSAQGRSQGPDRQVLRVVDAGRVARRLRLERRVHAHPAAVPDRSHRLVVEAALTQTTLDLEAEPVGDQHPVDDT